MGRTSLFLGRDREGPDPPQPPSPVPAHALFINVCKSRMSKTALSLEHLFQLSLGKIGRKPHQPFHRLQEKGSEVPVCFPVEPQWAQGWWELAVPTPLPAQGGACSFR